MTTEDPFGGSLWEHEPTPPLAAFRILYATDDTIWWRVGCGHHMNLFDMALDEIDSLAGASEECDRLDQENMSLRARLHELEGGYGQPTES